MHRLLTSHKGKILLIGGVLVFAVTAFEIYHWLYGSSQAPLHSMVSSKNTGTLAQVVERERE